MTRTRKKRFYKVRVKTLNSRKPTIYQLPNDLQSALHTYVLENKSDYKNLLKGSLINIPTEKYSEENNFEPVMTLAYVTDFFYEGYPTRRRTRGQFVTKDNWNKLSNFTSALRYLNHDFKEETRKRQRKELLLWHVKRLLRRLG